MPSINIETGIDDNFSYIVTPNAKQVLGTLISSFQTGIHSFTIIGTYGTGKSSFLAILVQDFTQNTKKIYENNGEFNRFKKFEIFNLAGDYTSLVRLFCNKLNCDESAFFKEFEKYYQEAHKNNKFLIVIVDEFGKILEHVANNNPEKELYFIQKFAEFVNDTKKNIVFITTLHQNFGTYSRKLTEEQRNEWTKVKGRFKEIVFIEPVEQLLFLTAQQLKENPKQIIDIQSFEMIFNIAKETKFINNTLTFNVAKRLYPIDIFAAYVLTLAVQRYGQNERSLFSFLNSKGNYSLENAEIKATKTYNLSDIYDYIIYNFHSFLSEVNADSMNWSAMHVALERVDGLSETKLIKDARKLVKTIGLLNLFASQTATIQKENLYQYAEKALDIKNPKEVLDLIDNYKIIRYAKYRKQYILFEGTDINIENELLKATVPTPSADVDEIKKYFDFKITPAIASFYKTGTPRFFEYIISNEAITQIPTGDTDGYINLIFPNSEKDTKEKFIELSKQQKQAIIYAYFNNTQDVIKHLHEICKFKFVLDKVLLDKSDKVAINEVNNLLSYEKSLLNKSINESLTAYNDNVTWFYNGNNEQINNLSDYNKLISRVCDEIYYSTPIIQNELFNRQKISGQISTARVNLLEKLIDDECIMQQDLGFEEDKFPPEKTIYYTLLKNTGIHRQVNGIYTLCEPSNDSVRDLWNKCEEFLQSAIEKQRKLGDLIKELKSAPFKLKQGFLDFWIPVYLIIRKQDYSLYDSEGRYIPQINREVLDLLQKSPHDFKIKTFAVEGVKIEFFNQYRNFINLNDRDLITQDSFLETIKPFFAFYNNLNEYAKNTQIFDNPKTAKFRSVLAKATDPEKTFFEDLPAVFGFKNDSLATNKEFMSQYQELIKNAIRELRLCYPNLINKIEENVVEILGLQSSNFADYKTKIENRFKGIKTSLLSNKQKSFLNRLLTPQSDKTFWYESICFVVFDKPLVFIKDNEVTLLIETLRHLFVALTKFIDISKIAYENSNSEIYNFELVSTKGTIKPQSYILPDSQKVKTNELEMKINEILSGDENLDVCTLLRILKSKISND
jgi:hypothetical protein